MTYLRFAVELRRALSEGWTIKFGFMDGDKEGIQAVDDVYAFAGDSNCSHEKEFDPSDGHGFSEVRAETLEEAFAEMRAIKWGAPWQG